MNPPRIDSHQHFWSYNPADYPWIQPDWPIRRDFLPPDLEPLLEQTGIQGTIAVQARQSLEETQFLLNLADHSPFIRGVVGWVDLASPQLEQQIDRFKSHPKFVGVRHVVQDEPDPNFMLRESFLRGIATLAPARLTYDILVFPHQLPAAIQLAATFPNQPFVLDHIAKPRIRDAILSPWREHIQQLAQAQNVHCKISGLVTEANHQRWSSTDFDPCLDVVFEAFGPERIMYGSDWPVCLLAASYSQVHSLVDRYASQLPAPHRHALFGKNAAHFYLGSYS